MAFSIMGRAFSISSIHAAELPKVQQPSAILDTLRPESPKETYSIEVFH
jgi:hypothetical protein